MSYDDYRIKRDEAKRKREVVRLFLDEYDPNDRLSYLQYVKWDITPFDKKYLDMCYNVINEFNNLKKHEDSTFYDYERVFKRIKLTFQKVAEENLLYYRGVVEAYNRCEEFYERNINEKLQNL